jgi:dethiobiotin synthetase
MSNRFFVTGTDTGVGKTEVSCALLSLLAERGQPFGWKPCETGDDSDSRRLWEAAGGWQRLEDVNTYRFRQPLAPGVAARLEKRSVSWRRLRETFERFGNGPGVVEGAGGLHVPLTATHDVVDLIAALRLPVVLVARAGLGTLNHTTLSMDALRARRLRVAAIVLSQGVKRGDPSSPHNAPELRRRFPRVPVLGPLPYLSQRQRRLGRLRELLAPLVASR